VVWVTHHSLFTRIAQRRCWPAVVQPGAAAGGLVLAFPTAELAFAMQHGSHGGTISALLLYAVASAAMLIFHA
jgi:hypothetical protein